MSEPVVNVRQGALKGKVLTNDNGKVYHSYQGVPYAKPPVGNLRFKPPQKPESWTGVRDATKEGNSCRSVHMILRNLIGDEDCLFLNVYVPQTSSSKPLPVMFWVHGGGFIMGSGDTDMYGPDYLMDHDVVLVTINYRLGVLGFLNLDLEDAPGNVGLMDQAAALKWVNENVSAFGGDPNNVTIFGESAGGASIHYLMMSDTTKGLFHKAIAQSGSAFNPWAFQRNHLKHAFHLCEILGHSTTDPKYALKFLQEQPIDKLVGAKFFNDHQLIDDFVFVPSVEKRYPGHEPFLTEHPLQRMKSGNFNKVPFMTGFNDGEGILFFMDAAKDPEMFNKFEADFEKVVPTDLALPLRSEASVKLAKELKKYYYQDEPVSENNKQKFVELMGDAWFVRGINNNVKLTLENSNAPVYYYEYCFSDHGFLKALFNASDVKGACHGDELGYLFKNQLSEFPQNMPSALANQKRLLQLWTNFAKTGNPTPAVNDLLPVKWEPATKQKLNYLSIGNTIAMGTNPEHARVQFWESVTNNGTVSHL